MDRIIAFIMTHPDVTVEIKKDDNFYESIDIKMRKNNSVTKRIIGEDRLIGLESILAYMYDLLCALKEDEIVEFQGIETQNCSECEHYEDHHTSLACAKCPVITKVWGGVKK